jgi:hypothetical protein
MPGGAGAAVASVGAGPWGIPPRGFRGAGLLLWQWAARSLSKKVSPDMSAAFWQHAGQFSKWATTAAAPGSFNLPEPKAIRI